MKAIDKILKDVDHPFDPSESIYTDSGPDCRTYLSFKGDKVFSHTVQDPSLVYAENQELRKHGDEMWRKAEVFRPYARVPLALWLHWESLGITQDKKALMQAIELMKDEVKLTSKKF